MVPVAPSRTGTGAAGVSRGRQRVPALASDQAGGGGELAERGLGAGADVADDLGGGEAAELCARRHVAALGQAVEESGRVEVAGAGGVDHLLDRVGVDGGALAVPDDDGAVGAAGQHGEAAILGDAGGGVLEGVRLIERGDLALVGEQDGDAGLDEVEELGAVAVDAEAVGEGEGDVAAGLAGDLGGLAEGGLGLRAVEQVALEVDDLGGGDGGPCHLAVVELGRAAEERVHGALAVGGDEDQRARRGGAAVGGRGVEGDAGGLDIVAENAAELVARHLADEGRGAAQRGEADHGVGRRAAGHLYCRAHVLVERLDGGGVDEAHVALGGVVGLEEGVVAPADDVDDGVADGDDVGGSGCGHVVVPLGAGAL